MPLPKAGSLYNPILQKAPPARSRTPLEALEWSIPLEHEVIACVQSRLCVGQGNDLKGSLRFSLEVWADGRDRRGQLAYCRGSICPREMLLFVHWLGRAKECPSICVAPCEPCLATPVIQEEEDDLELSESETGSKSNHYWQHTVTVAMALLGIAAALGKLFGVTMVELEAEDDGSGRLIQYYSSLGFEVTAKPPEQKGHPFMEASAKSIARHAPLAWFADLVPTDFDAGTWLQEGGGKHPIERFLQLASSNWQWKVTHPHGAELEVQLSSQKADLNRVCFDIDLRNCHGIEVAKARGAVRLRQGTLRILWVGRSKSQPIHPSVKGKFLYQIEGSAFEPGAAVSESSEALATAGAVDVRKVTAAVAMIGILAVLGRWLGATSVEIMAMDDGSGRLVQYFKAIGFVESKEPSCNPQCDDPIAMKAKCEELAMRCCPEEWRGRLPAEVELTIFDMLPKED